MQKPRSAPHRSVCTVSTAACKLCRATHRRANVAGCAVDGEPLAAQQGDRVCDNSGAAPNDDAGAAVACQLTRDFKANTRATARDERHLSACERRRGELVLPLRALPWSTLAWKGDAAIGSVLAEHVRDNS